MLSQPVSGLVMCTPPDIESSAKRSDELLVMWMRGGGGFTAEEMENIRRQSERNLAMIGANRVPNPRPYRPKSSTGLSPAQLEWLRLELLNWFRSS